MRVSLGVRAGENLRSPIVADDLGTPTCPLPCHGEHGIPARIAPWHPGDESGTGSEDLDPLGVVGRVHGATLRHPAHFFEVVEANPFSTEGGSTPSTSSTVR